MIETIATRTLELLQPGGGTTSVIATLARPEPVGDGPDHRCAYFVTGLAQEIEGFAQGIDGLHALFLAMVHIGIRVRHSAECKQGRVRWIEGRADLGLPPTACVGHLL